ncbi:MAG: DNA repair protein RecO [Atopobium sp.]|uniref:DNA repair protein RecO n=1 Tax=Atopobium sp. TaxID=1872650 RepID=UPI002A75AC0F|nr:DNA repair protein RecO [Atopobium sp.]MDY2788196.1 DNA repair protein RecO [Atopobium sp.]MDY4522558.1 DNA repair protein RecO [Atopobium sp.]
MPRGRTFRTKGIVLHKTKLGEQDIILTFLADDGSQHQAVAKGARKPGGRLAARCDLFCEVDFLLAQGRSLNVVAEASLITSHQVLRTNLEHMSCASCVVEIAQHSSFEDARDSFLFPLLSRVLLAIEQAHTTEQLDLIITAYVFKILAHQGWRAQLDACVVCGDSDVSRFSAAMGGVVCESCASHIEGAELITQTEIKWLDALLHMTFDQILAVQIDKQTVLYLISLAHIWAVTHLDCRLRAFEYYLSV